MLADHRHHPGLARPDEQPTRADTSTGRDLASGPGPAHLADHLAELRIEIAAEARDAMLTLLTELRGVWHGIR
ncbi:hypothetical protein [Streptomyces niveus]|uniref:hypothetical protein n=1 Tax=Streptomyces niveus TaxID=193462 RepID=UPI0036313493